MPMQSFLRAGAYSVVESARKKVTVQCIYNVCIRDAFKEKKNVTNVTLRGGGPDVNMSMSTFI